MHRHLTTIVGMRPPGAGHRGRVFYSYLLSFLLILLVPVVMSVFIFGRANRLITSETSRANATLLEATGIYLDQLLTDAGQLRYLIANNNRLQSLLVSRGPAAGDEYYAAYGLVEELKTYRDSSLAVIDFYVYIPALDMVISPNGYFSTLSYDLVMRDRSVEPRETWLGQLVAVRGQAVRPGRTARDPRIDVTSFVPAIDLVVPIPLEQAMSAPRGFAVLHLDAAPFSRPLAEAKWAERSIFVTVSPGRQVLASSDPQLDFAPLIAGYSGRAFAWDGERIIIDGDQHVGFTRSSESSFSWTYVEMIPADVYATDFGRLRRFTLGAFVLCAIIGGLLIYLITRLRYRPIQNLLAMLEPEADGSFTLRSDEFDIIRVSLRATLAEGSLLRQEVAAGRSLYLNRTLQQLLKGTTTVDDELAGRLRRLGFASDSRYRRMAGFDPDLPGPTLYPAIVEQVRQAVADWNEGNAVVVEVDGVICVLVGSDTTSWGSNDRLLAELKDKIEARHGISCAVGISHSHPSEDGFAVHLKEMRAALGYRLVKGASSPIHFSDVHTTGQAYFYPIEDENRLINSIAAGAYPAASEILGNVFEANFTHGQLSVEMARCLMFDLIATMVRSLNSLSLADSDAEFWSQTRPVTRLIQCHSLEELRSQMTAILRSVCDHVLESRTSRAVELRNDMVAIIADHLHEKDLGPEFVADQLGMNGAYVARFFRDEMGCGMSQHIKELRVSEARALLINTEDTVREIALLVGFSDSNALIRAFKSIEGLTPGDFRQSRATH